MALFINKEFDVSFNEKSKHFIITTLIDVKQSLTTRQYTSETTVKVIDEHLKLLVENPYNFKGYDYRRPASGYDNNDNIYSISSEKVEGSNMSTSSGELDRLYIFNPTTGKTASHDLLPALTNKKYRVESKSTQIVEDSTGAVYLATLYGHYFKPPIYGVYLAKIDPVTGKLSKETLIPWTESEDPKDNGKEEIELEKYDFRDVRFFSDGSAKILISQDFEGLNGGYRSQNLCEIKLNSAWKISDMTFIPRNQFLLHSYYIECITFNQKNDSYFIYNENPDLINSDMNSKLKVEKKEENLVPCITHIGKTGAIDRKVLLPKYSGASITMLCPGAALKMDKNEYIAMLAVDDRFNFVKISFQE